MEGTGRAVSRLVPALRGRRAGAGLGLAFWIASASVALAISPAFPTSQTIAPPPVHRVAVFGSDDRTKLPARYKRLGSHVGLLYHPRAHSACTAFCVGRDTIVTAAHCLFRTSDEKPPRLRDFSFRINPRRPGKTSRIMGARTRSVTQHVAAGSTRLSVRPPIDATRDWAIVRLAEPVCPADPLRISRLGPRAVAKQAARGAIYQIAYHRDFGNWTLALGRNCQLQGIRRKDDLAQVAQDFVQPGNLLLHDCDTGGASSGSPLFIDGADGPEVVGINVGTYVQSKVKVLNGEVLERFTSDDVANTAVASAAFAAMTSAFLQADLLSTPADIRKLQALLAGQGRYTARIDGAYGPRLRAAIESYERASSSPVTGLASRQLLHRLETVKPPLSMVPAVPAPQTIVALRPKQH